MKKLISTIASGLSSPYEDAEKDLDIALVDYSNGDRIGKPMVFSSAEFNEGYENADADVKELINAGGNVPTMVTASVTPTTSAQNITPDTGKAFNKVEVAAVTAAIDEDIVAENIKSGVTILGVEGTYVKPEDANLLPENIKAGVTIYGVEGTYTGEPVEDPQL